MGMNVRFERLIGGARGQRTEGTAGLLDDLRALKERRGEKIAAVDPQSGALLGAVALHPEKDEGGTFFRLAGIDVLPSHRGQGLEAGLLAEAETYLRAHRCHRLKFGTSPLLTDDAGLYVTRFGTRYRWSPGNRTPEGRPWPHVSCECDFDDPLARPLDLRDEEVSERSVLAWSDGRPVRRQRIVYSGPLSVLLPDLTMESVTRSAAADPSYLETLYAAFHELARHGYGFAWFDRLPSVAAGSAGSARWYYVMNAPLAL